MLTFFLDVFMADALEAGKVSFGGRAISKLEALVESLGKTCTWYKC